MNRIPELYALVVDDNEVDRELLAERLKRVGIKNITVFSNAQEALAHLKENLVHVVFTDFEMADMNGLDLASQIRENSVTTHIRVIVVTTLSENELKAGLAQSRARYLNKFSLGNDVVLHVLQDLFRY